MKSRHFVPIADHWASLQEALELPWMQKTFSRSRISHWIKMNGALCMMPESQCFKWFNDLRALLPIFQVKFAEIQIDLAECHPLAYHPKESIL